MIFVQDKQGCPSLLSTQVLHIGCPQHAANINLTRCSQYTHMPFSAALSEAAFPAACRLAGSF